MADIGFGATITFGSSFFSGIRSMSWSGISREAVDVSSQDSTSAMDFLPADLYDPGELSIEGVLGADMDWTTPIAAAAESVTVTLPLKSGQATAESWAASGFMTSYEPDVPYDGEMTYSATIKFTGAITHTSPTLT